MVEEKVANTELPADEEEMLEEEELGASDDKFLAGVAKLMPWVISLLFHVGLFLIMLFLVMIVFVEETPEEVIIPDSVLSDNPTPVSPSSASKSKSKSTSSKRNPIKSKRVSADAGKTDKALDIIGGGGGSGGSRSMGMGTAGSGGGGFFGTGTGKGGGNAHNIVYVIDRSGSMSGTFESVKNEMLKSIGRLKESQSFHIILFAEGSPLEPRNRNLKRATIDNKLAANDFLDPIIAEGQTSPVQAINRAFSVLSKTRKPGRLIYLLTDAGFDDNPAVLSAISAKNSALKGNNKVLINTFLYGNKPEEAVAVMEKIAADTGGRYKYVPIDE
jgi:hypothetical protein